MPRQSLIKKVAGDTYTVGVKPYPSFGVTVISILIILFSGSGCVSVSLLSPGHVSKVTKLTIKEQRTRIDGPESGSPRELSIM